MRTDQVLSYWQQYMSSQDLTDRTIGDRIRFIQQLESTIGDPLTATRYDLIGFLGTPGWENSTRQHYRSALHTFYTWMQDEGLRVDNPAVRLPRVKPRPVEPNPVPVSDIQRILESGAYLRTRMMIAVHYYLGMRVHEIAKIHGRDIDRANRIITVYGKGKKTRYIPLNDAVWALAEQMPADGYWFPNWKQNRLYMAGEGHILSNSVSTLIGNAMRRTGVTHRPHDLRASFVTEQSDAGAPADVVQSNAGHSNYATTMRYNKVSIERRRQFGVDCLPVVQMPSRSGRRAAA